ncbi:hypothetical protein D3C78_1396420 [compost metagenome]
MSLSGLESRGVQHKDRGINLDHACVAKHLLLQLRCIKRMQRPYLAGLQHTLGADWGRQGQPAKCNKYKGSDGTPTCSSTTDDLRPAQIPCCKFGPERLGNEPHNLHQKQQDAQRLDKEVIDQGGNTQKKNQSINPGSPGKQDEPATFGIGKRLRGRFTELE